MGIVVEVNSLDEMCDMMCNNALPKEKPRWWIFTFGCGQKHEGYYVKIKGTFDSARHKMFAKYGEDWSFQYSEEVWEDMKKDPNRYWPVEKELEVIE